MNTTRRFLCTLMLSACALMTAQAQAQAAGYERGPDPSAALLNATGPYAVSGFKISRDDAKSHNYGGATVYYPQAPGQTFGVVALQPWHTTKSFAGDAVPTLIVACEKDNIATNKTHSDLFYASLNPLLPRAEIEIKGAGHLCSTFLGSKAHLTTSGKASVAWLKRFLDEDMRYDAMVKGGINEGEFSRFLVQGF